MEFKMRTLFVRARQEAYIWYNQTFGYLEDSTKETLDLIGTDGYENVDAICGKADHIYDENGDLTEEPELSSGEYDAMVWAFERVGIN
jgi:hypothetical protein